MTQEQFRQAKQLHQRGDLPGAIASYSALLEEDASLADAWHLKGMAEHQSGRLEEARASVARAIAAT